MYEFNTDYFKENLSNQDSELVKALLDYDGVLPCQLSYPLNIYINPLNLPRDVLYKIREKHDQKLIEHSRYEAFKLPGESFGECDDRLIKELLDVTGLPIFEEVEQ